MIEETFGLLRLENFIQTVNIPNTKSEILRYEVPEHLEITLLPEKPIELRFMTMENFVFTTATGATTHTVTVAGDMQDSPDLGNVGDAVILRKNSPAPEEEWLSANINYPANSITFTGLASETSYNFDVFYMFGGGLVEIEIIEPARRVREPLFGLTTTLINRRRQIDDRSAMILPYAETLYPKYLLSVFLTAPLPVSFDSWARNTVIQIFYSSEEII